MIVNSTGDISLVLPERGHMTPTQSRLPFFFEQFAIILFLRFIRL